MKKFMFIIFVLLFFGCISEPDTFPDYTESNQDTNINSVATAAQKPEPTVQKTPEENWSYFITANERYPELTPLRKEWRRREFSKKGKNDRIEACTEKARARNRKGCGQR